MNGRITVVIADDHPLFRKGLTEVLREDPAVEIVGEAGDGDLALRLIEDRRPTVAILDLDMPRRGGLLVAEAARRQGLAVALIILTMYDDGRMLDRALELGVKGYVLKDNAASDILACLHLVAAGRSYVSPSLAQHLVERRGAMQAVDGSPAVAALTAVERRVLGGVARELTTRAIAAELGVSPKTVENHRSRICAKLGVHGTNALVRFAVRHRDALG